MISTIIFLCAVIFVYVNNLFIFNGILTLWTITWICVVAIGGMIAINGIIAIICCKIMPNSWFNPKFKIYTASKRECKFYERIGIKKWKDKTAEYGRLNNFSKNKITEPDNPEYIQRFILENNKGFLTHLVSAILSFPAIFILPMRFWIPMALPIAITSFILNVIPIMILRYNMPRLQIMLVYAERRAAKQDKKTES